MSTRRDFISGGAAAATSLALPLSGSVLAADDQQNSNVDDGARVVNAAMLAPAPSNTIVSAVFSSAVAAYNSRDWPTLSSLLDDNVTANTVHSNGFLSAELTMF